MLGTCIERHAVCKTNDPHQDSRDLYTPRFLPKRLLRVVRGRTGFEVRLCETDTLNGSNFPYTALSHCWGSTPIIKTTTETMSGFKREGIRWEDLPKTFQEAIMLTRMLAISYIWIDSLCKFLRNVLNLAAFTEFPDYDRYFARLCGRMGPPSFPDG